MRLPIVAPPGDGTIANPSSQKPTEPQTKLPAPKTPPPASQIPGLVGYWTFDEGDVAPFADHAGKNDLARAEEVSSVPGIRGKAINFTGPDSFVDLGANADLNFPARVPFSVACWVKTKADSGTVVSFRNSKDDGAAVSIFIQDNLLRATVRQDRASSPALLVGLAPINDDQWHHAALIRDGNVISLYVDGQPQGKATTKGIGEAITTDWRYLGREQRWLSMGQQSSSGIKGFYVGAMDELCIFRRALSPDELRTLAGR